MFDGEKSHINCTTYDVTFAINTKLIQLFTIFPSRAVGYIVIMLILFLQVILSGVFFIAFVSMAILGGTMLMSHMGGTVPSWLPVCSMMVSVFVFACGISPLPFIIMTEMFSFQVR